MSDKRVIAVVRNIDDGTVEIERVDTAKLSSIDGAYEKFLMDYMGLNEEELKALCSILLKLRLKAQDNLAWLEHDLDFEPNKFCIRAWGESWSISCDAMN